MTRFDDAFLCAFGAIAMRFSELEELVFRHAAKLVDGRDFGIGEAILAGMELRRVTEIFEALIRERTGWRYTIMRNPHHTTATVIQDRLKPLLSKIDRVREKRNQIFHAYWSPRIAFNTASESFGQSKASVVRTKRQKKRNEGSISKTTRWTVAELQAAAAEMEEAATEIDEFVTWANTLMPLFPEEEEWVSLTAPSPHHRPLREIGSKSALHLLPIVPGGRAPTANNASR